MSEYPRMLYHRDGRMAQADSAHHETHDFGEGWSREPHDVHRQEPASGRWNTPTAAIQADPGTVPARPLDSPGPVDAGTVRAIIREEMQAHPGLDLSDTASPDDIERLSARIDALAKALGAELPDETPPDETPRKRRGRPPGSTNKLTGAAGATE